MGPHLGRNRRTPPIRVSYLPTSRPPMSQAPGDMWDMNHPVHNIKSPSSPTPENMSIYVSVLQRTLAIMVPTGKVGPITPRKVVPEVVVVQEPYRKPAEVWERVDEGPNPYQPPVYKYTLLDFARKYGRKTLIPPPEEEYYRPRPRVVNYNYNHIRPPVYYKTKFYYSPLQAL